MCHKLSVHVKIVFAGGDTQGGNVYRYMEDPKEGQCKHGGKGVCEGSPIDRGEILLNVSIKEGFKLAGKLTIEAVEVIPRIIGRGSVKCPPLLVQSVHGDSGTEDNNVEQHRHANKVDTDKKI